MCIRDRNKTVSKKLETIADDCADNDIAFVKIDDKEEAGQYGLDQIPTLMFFNEQVNKFNSDNFLIFYISRSLHCIQETCLTRMMFLTGCLKIKLHLL